MTETTDTTRFMVRYDVERAQTNLNLAIGIQNATVAMWHINELIRAAQDEIRFLHRVGKLDEDGNEVR